jgi:hypothetical protein
VAATAQYPGKITKSDVAAPELRAVAVLEWTGEAGKPSASRLVPVAVYDGQQLYDGTIYLNRPQPLALTSGVEYELQKAGKPLGVFDVFSAGEIDGSWLGFGTWRPLSAIAAAKADNAFNTSSLYGGTAAAEDDKPVLKRKHPKGTDSDDNGSSGGAGGTSTSSGSGLGSGSSTGNKTSASGGSTSDGPVLKRKDSESSGTTSTSSASNPSAVEVDPDRPTIRRNRKEVDPGMLETSTAAPDPDRPRLKRGKPTDPASLVSPRLTGYPASMQQAVAVSDAASRTEHPWKYTWANPADEMKMKLAMEDMARKELGMDAPSQPAKSKKPTAAQKTAKVSMLPKEPAQPAALEDEQFRVFELAYGSSATLVLTASSPKPVVPSASDSQSAAVQSAKAASMTKRPGAGKAGSNTPIKPPAQKFVTLIAQPDLYGGLLVIYKSKTDSAHLDDTPRMRLVDAVDAEGDNRGELLFELRGSQQRQFALFRVLRGSAEQLFATVAIP